MKSRNLNQTVLLLLAVGLIVFAYQSGLFAGSGTFMVEVKTPSGVAPRATCYLMKDGSQIASTGVSTITNGKTGCKFTQPATIYDLVVQCDSSPMHEDREDIEIFPPSIGGQAQTVCWGTFYSSGYCQWGKEITLACTADACDSVVGEICKGNEVWSVCRNGILKDYKRTCGSGSCMQTVMRKSGQTVLQSEVACQTVDQDENSSIESRYVQACVSQKCQQVLKTVAGTNYVPCTGIGTGCGGGSNDPAENTCSYDFQCGYGGTVGDSYCQGGNLVRDSTVKACVNGYCQTTYKSNLVKDCKGWGCNDDVGACNADQTVDTGCSSGADCGTNGYVGVASCTGGNVVQDYKTYSCSSKVCSASISPKVVKTCTGSCNNGQCEGTSVTTTTIAGQTTTTTLGGGGEDNTGGLTTTQMLIIILVPLIALLVYLWKSK